MAGETTWRRTLNIVTDPASVRRVREEIFVLARDRGAGEETATDLKVAVGEALANAQQHAYSGGAGPLEIDIQVSGEICSVEICDEGRPVTLPRVPADASSPGRGLYLISRLVDEVHIERNRRTGEGTSIRLVKRIPAGSP